MIQLLTALKCEARPLIEAFNLVRCQGNGPHELYQNGELQLLVSGPGKTAAAAATAFAFACSGQQENTAWLNIGIAGHRQLQPGAGALVNKITDAASNRCWYPPIVFTPQCDQENLITVDKEESEFAQDALYDMEAAGFYDTASRYATAELVQSYKIVSDNVQTSTTVVTAKAVSALVRAHVPQIRYLVDELQGLARQLLQVNDIPACYQTICDRWHFTVYQKNQLKRLLKKWSVQHEEASNVDDAILAQLQHCKDGGKVISRLEGRFQRTGRDVP